VSYHRYEAYKSATDVSEYAGLNRDAAYTNPDLRSDIGLQAGAPHAAVRHLRNKKPELRPAVLPEFETTYGVRPSYLYDLGDVATGPTSYY